jgi:hypothetical protein
MPRVRTILPALLVCGAAHLNGASVSAQSTGSWTAGAPMPSQRGEIATAETGGKIYIVGAFTGERELEIYDPAANSWSRGAGIPRSLHHTAAAGLNGKLYVFGG